MIPSDAVAQCGEHEVYQRGLVIDSQLDFLVVVLGVSVSKGIGD